ncbi:MAG TPA: hypothetical protein VFA07_04330 [Chthonomonadaceae bacterium]|nr:hypothetical protein [Chthonomonadaceae bacterium]
MQRILFALMALASLAAVNLRPAQAQNTMGQTGLVSAPPTEETVTLSKEETKDNLRVDGEKLILEGHVQHDVLAINSDVTIKPGASVGGHLVAIGGHVDDQAHSGINVIQLDPGILSGSNVQAAPLPPPAAPPQVNTPAPAAKPGHHRGSWPGQQFAILLLGMLGGLVLWLIAPRATEQASGTIVQEPARCLVVGGIGAAGMLFAAVADGALMHSPLGLLWKPFGAVLAFALLVTLAFSWLCGMRFAGDLIARKFGQTSAGHAYGRMALGLLAFFVVNMVLGAWLGVVGMLVEALLALMGLGALFVTGFGSDPQWLSARLHRRT